MKKKYNSIVVGGGPAGLTAALYIARAGKSVLVIENEGVGSLAAAHKIENYPGFPEGISGKELIAKMKEHAAKYGAEFLNTIFFEIDTVSSENKIVKCEAGKFETDTVVMATGIWKGGSSSKFKGEEEFLGRGVSYCATCDGAFYRGMKVSVFGNGEEACEEALYLTQFASEVTLFSAEEELKCEESTRITVTSNEKIKLYYNRELLEIKGSEFVESVLVKDNSTGESREFETAAAFIYMGTKSNYEIYAPIAELNDKGHVKTNEKLESYVEGVYVAGDIREKSIRQITTAVADGTVAASEVLKYLLQKK